MARRWYADDACILRQNLDLLESPLGIVDEELRAKAWSWMRYDGGTVQPYLGKLMSHFLRRQSPSITGDGDLDFASAVAGVQSKEAILLPPTRFKSELIPL